MTPAVFGHGHLRLYLLKLLDESPRHGYELIQELSERFGGTYSPSAGTIYPRLAKLEDEGLVTKESDGRKTVYRITEAGRAEVNARAEELDGIEHGLETSIRQRADSVRSDVERAMKSLRAELAAARREPSSRRAAKGAETSAPVVESREETKVAVRELDVTLASFRATVRSAARKHAAGEQLDIHRVHELRRELDGLAQRFVSALDRRES